MLLNGGALDGARVLKAETVALMGQNHIGAVSVPALKTALPRSADFTFIADGRDKWGLGFLITTDQVPGKRSPGSLSWGGINNTFFWIDPARGIAGVIMMQYLPFADAKALAVYDAFERGAYQLVNGRAVEALHGMAGVVSAMPFPLADQRTAARNSQEGAGCGARRKREAPRDERAWGRPSVEVGDESRDGRVAPGTVARRIIPSDIFLRLQVFRQLPPLDGDLHLERMPG